MNWLKRFAYVFVFGAADFVIGIMGGFRLFVRFSD
jgi:hypothetical protein